MSFYKLFALYSGIFTTNGCEPAPTIPLSKTFGNTFQCPDYKIHQQRF